MSHPFRRGSRSCGRLLNALLLVGPLLAPRPAGLSAQTDPVPDASAPSAAAAGAEARVGVALSGGSAKGLAHVGALRELERAGIPVHVVAGTSMGAVIGGLYAAGVSTDSLEVLARGLEWTALLTDAVERERLSVDRRFFDQRVLITFPFEDGSIRLPSGAVAGHRVLRVFEELTWRWAHVRDFRRLPRPFAALATDLETGEAVRLDRGVLAHALRASVAIPGAVEPLRLDGRILVDGGLARNLPAEDARALGAERVVCIDVSDPLDDADELRTLVDVLLQTVSFRSVAATERQRELCDLLVRPDTDGLSPLDFDRADEWIARGARAVRAALDSTGFSADGSTWAGEGERADPLTDSVRVEGFEVEGLSETEAVELVRATLEPEDGWARPLPLRSALEELDATGLFRDLRYRLDREGETASLRIQAERRAQDRVGVGLRYDNHLGAALLFTGEAMNWLRFGSVTRLEVRLGEEIRIGGSFLRGRGVTSSLSLGLEADWQSAPLDVVVEEEAGGGEARIDVNLLGVRGLAGATLGRGAILGVEGGVEWARATTDIAPVDSVVSETFAHGAAVVRLDETDRSSFPRRGVRLEMRSELGWGSIEGGDVFHRQIVLADVFAPLAPRLTLQSGGYLGYAGGDGLPLHRRFFAGGVNPSTVFRESHPSFLGVAAQELRGRAVQILRLGLRWEVAGGRYLGVEVDTGAVRESWTVDPGDYRWGWGLTAGTETFVGPMRLTLHGRSLEELRGALSLGRAF